jgi:hypothetical protein
MKVFEVSTSKEIESNDLEQNDLINYLCELVLSMTDDEIKQAKTNLNELTKSVQNKNGNFKAIKKNLDSITSELAKEKQLRRILIRIETLNKEGSLRGQKKTSILKILPQLKSYDFSKLSRLEEKLSIF